MKENRPPPQATTHQIMTSAGMPPPTTAPPPAPDPDLNECANAIIAESRSHTARGQANLHLAMVGLAAILGREQQGALGRMNVKDSPSVFPIRETPAMREILTNPQLFHALLSMLSSNTHQADSSDLKSGRKRSPSEENAFPARKKQMLATPPPNRPQLYSSRQTSQSQLTGATAPNGSDSAGIQVFAAVVLYSVLQHIDHWPVELMRLFAEDTFGQRTWVDNDSCKDLVANLEMSLHPSVLDDDVDSATALVADEVEAHFSSMATKTEHSDISRQSLPKSVIVSSQQKMPSAKEIRVQSKHAETIDDESSSSGEEEILESNSMDIDPVEPQNRNITSTDILQTLFQPSTHSKKRIRSRYIAHNKDSAYEAISDALVDRLNSKSKQNSRLLQTLPRFLFISRVRCLTSRHIDRWIQSPALAGLARNLLSQITKTFSNTADDVEVLDNVLKMKLKTNQFPMHVENITSIAKRVPTYAVANQVFIHCLTGEVPANGCESAVMNPGHEHFEILRSVYKVLDPALAAKSLASAVLHLTSGDSTQSHSRPLRLVANTLGDLFDAFEFAEYIIQSKTGSTNISDANKNARFIFDCAMLVGFSNNSTFKQKMMHLRKVILRWCVSDLGSVYYKRISQHEKVQCNDTYDGNGAVIKGPGASDFRSYLNPVSIEKSSSIHKFMTVVRCLLFLTPPSMSMDLESFASRSFDDEELECIKLCCAFKNVDDEMLEMVLESSLTSSMAIGLIENLILGCRDSIEDVPISSHVVLKMYELSEYDPQFHPSFNSKDLKIPQLSHSGLWWRVTAVALAICGLSSSVGSDMWKQHPTLRSLIKMTTSQKYRFPTADCDDTKKELIRAEDGKMKELEMRLAELLFAAPKKHDESAENPVQQHASEFREGLRFSARQREKRDKILFQERERIAAAKHAEQMKLRKQLKMLQKAIMIYNPNQQERKPPKDSIDLILAINISFLLAERFRSSIDPDYLLQTIGDGRSAIERAYDWLIPIISQKSQVIHRLQPSSTCFILLKAYSADANKELVDLSAPLLCHVRKCLNGEFGERHSLLSLELLLTDIASENAERRRCSRKVLQQSIPNNFGICGWLRQLMNYPNAALLIPLTIEYLSRALNYERGKVLSKYILSLHEFNSFIQTNNLHHKLDFIARICQLVSSRPHVCADAMDANDDLRMLLLTEITLAFDKAVNEIGFDDRIDEDGLVSLQLPASEQQCNPKRAILVPLYLLRAAVVVISNWQDRDQNQRYENPVDTETTSSNSKSEEFFTRLLGYLITPAQSNMDMCPISGLATAVYKQDNTPVSSIEDWISLTRAKTAYVAKHATLSAPNIFLPRLLLCCGLSDVSFSTMLHRINELGNSTSEPNKVFRELLTPAAISRWGLSRVGGRKKIKRKLLGRILAYQQKDLQQTGFVSWLKSECSSSEKSKKSLPQHCHESATDFVQSCIKNELKDDSVFTLDDGNEVEASPSQTTHWFGQEDPDDNFSPNDAITKDFIRSCIVYEKFDVLEESLQLRHAVVISKQVDDLSSVNLLLEVYRSFQGDDQFECLLLKWVPVLYQAREDDSFQHSLFVDLVGKYSVPFDTCMKIIDNCALQWPREQILGCRRWIIGQQTKGSWKDHLSLKLVVRFFAMSSDLNNQLSIDDAGHLLSLSVDLFNISIQESMVAHEHSITMKARNVLPDWLSVFLAVAKEGLPYLNLAITHVMNAIDENPQGVSFYSSVLLRLYTSYPATVVLSEVKLKTALLQGAIDNSDAWLTFRCPLDSQIKTMISNISKSPHKPLLQSVVRISNQHPLLIMRHLNAIKQGLLDDGSGVDSNGKPLIKRGRIQGKTPEMAADINGKLIKVSVVHWGYSFNEPVWSCMLDLLLSVPAEVLFKVGTQTGLCEIMAVFSKLFDVHIKELNAESNIHQLREKFERLASSFMNCNPEKYQNFMESK